MKQRLYYILILLIWGGATIQGQDVQYSQFYNDPLYINPALAGAGKVNRAGLHFRDQWPGIKESYKTYSAFVDRYSPAIKSGFGLMVVQDVAGTGALTYTGVAMNYSYLLVLDYSNTLRLGIKAEIGNRRIDFSKLLFADQVIRDRAPNSLDEFENNVVYYPNTAFGFEWSNSKLNLRFGAAIDHLNSPDQSFTSQPNKMPLLFSTYVLHNFYLNRSQRLRREQYFKAGAYYKFEEKWDQLEIGTNYHHKNVEIGLWFRGLPALKSYKPGYSNTEAVIIYLGLQYNGIHFGYNYDATISRLLINNSKGSHELTIVYGFSDPKKKKKRRMIPCSDLMGNSLR